MATQWFAQGQGKPQSNGESPEAKAKLAQAQLDMQIKQAQAAQELKMKAEKHAQELALQDARTAAGINKFTV